MSIQTINLQSQPMPIDGDRDSCSAQHQPARSYLATKRALDIIVSLIALAVIAPAVIAALIRGFRREGTIDRIILVGRRLRRFMSFTSRSAMIRRFFRLLDVLRGHASIVGPRLTNPSEAISDALALRNEVIPGLICLHWLRLRGNVALASEQESDREYAEKRRLKLDISILLRAILASFYGQPAVNFDATVQMLGVRIDNMTQDQALESIESSIDGEIAPAHIAFVNADCLNKAARVGEYRRKLNGASLVLADGIGVKIAGSILARPIRQNVNGTDLFPHLCRLLEKKTGRLYLLGAKAEVVQALAAKIRINYPSVVLCGAVDGYFCDEDAQVNEIAAARPDVLLVAMGAPVQELFIARNADRLGAKVCIGVGGLFDFYSGRVQRAPRWMRDSGLEWVYRLMQEPGRMWKRYLLGNGAFLGRILAERFGLAGGYSLAENVRVS